MYKIISVQTLSRKTTSVRVNHKMILTVFRKQTSKKIKQLLWLPANQFIYLLRHTLYICTYKPCLHVHVYNNTSQYLSHFDFVPLIIQHHSFASMYRLFCKLPLYGLKLTFNLLTGTMQLLKTEPRSGRNAESTSAISSMLKIIQLKWKWINFLVVDICTNQPIT